MKLAVVLAVLSSMHVACAMNFHGAYIVPEARAARAADQQVEAVREQAQQVDAERKQAKQPPALRAPLSLPDEGAVLPRNIAVPTRSATAEEPTTLGDRAFERIMPYLTRSTPYLAKYVGPRFPLPAQPERPPPGLPRNEEMIKHSEEVSKAVLNLIQSL